MSMFYRQKIRIAPNRCYYAGRSPRPVPTADGTASYHCYGYKCFLLGMEHPVDYGENPCISCVYLENPDADVQEKRKEYIAELQKGGGCE